MRAVTTVLAALLLLGFLTGGAAPSPATAQSLSSPLSRDPLGANDWDCRPTTQRPSPAVIVHGTFGDRSSLLDPLSHALKSDGYCVFSLDYGDRATGPIEDSAAQLADYVDRVLAATGAERVSIVGHSQGGMMPALLHQASGRRRPGRGPGRSRPLQSRHRGLRRACAGRHQPVVPLLRPAGRRLAVPPRPQRPR